MSRGFLLTSKFDKDKFPCKMVAMKEKDNLKNIQDSIRDEAVKEKVAKMVIGKKKISNKEVNEMIASETLKYEDIRRRVTEMAMGKKEESISEALESSGFTIIEETKYFGPDPIEKP